MRTTDLTLVTYEEWAGAALRRAAPGWPGLRLRVASSPADDGWNTADVVWWGALDPEETPPRGRLGLDDLAAASGLDLAPFGALLDLERSGGWLYALPTGYGAQLLCYRPAAFVSAGTPAPSADVSWSGLVDLVGGLRRKGVERAFGSGAFGWTAALLSWQAGVDAADPASLHASIERIRDLQAAARQPLPDRRPFMTQAPALEIANSVVQALSLSPGETWGVLPIPRADVLRPHRHFWWRSHVYVRAGTHDPEAAFALAARIATSDPGEALSDTGEFPAHLPTKERPQAAIALPAGHQEVRGAAEAADRAEWGLANPFRQRDLWAGLQRALDEGWGPSELTGRLAAVMAEAPT